MRTYAVLRDLSRPVTAGPFERAAAARGAAEAPAEPRIDVQGLSKRDVLEIARDPEVKALAPIMPTRLIEPVEMKGQKAAKAVKPAKATKKATPTWGVTAVGAATSARTGAGVAVSVLDTGIDAAHPAFAGVEIVQQDFSGTGIGDKQGHGTHCAGTIFGRDVDGTRIGVAPGVQKALIGKVLGDNGSGDSDMIFRGIQWAVQEGAQVISMSLGFDFPGLVKSLVGQGWPADLATSAALEAYRANLRMFDALMEMVRSRDAFGAGCIVVAAAGNESERQQDPDYEIAVSIPAAAEGVVSVGALAETSSGLQIAPFSNTLPQVAAPGVNVISAKLGGGLRPLNGTSMATPHVAGVAALWWEEITAAGIPSQTASAAVLARLLSNATTTDLAPDLDPADRGVGLVQAP